MAEMGMDPERVLALASRLDASGSRVSTVAGTVDRMVAGMPALWRGPSVQQFLADWSSHRASLGSASDAIHELARKARTNAHEQQRTSRDYGPVSGSGAGSGSSAPGGAAQTAALPPAGTSPAQLAQWWAHLSPAQQAYLLSHDYDAIGQEKGLPAAVLDVANRHRLSDDAANLQQQLDGLAPDSPLRQVLQQRLDDDNGILAELAKPGPGQPPAHTYLLTFDPTSPGGQTGVEISYGDPDTAANTAVVVPGTGHRASGLGEIGDDGRALYGTIADPSKAVVVWLDGPEPADVPHAGLDSYANDSAPRLVTDLDALRTAHVAATADAGHLTAVGHSYGSYILGKALTDGAKPDDVIFVGSPGVGVNHAGDLGIDPGHVWDGQAGDDPILLSDKRFTPDPFNGVNPEEGDFGDQHFSVDGSHGHSQYYKSGSESLRNIAAISGGDYDSVNRVDAPDYRGVRELPGDLLGSAVNPFYTEAGTLKDLATGHPIDALGRQWEGAVTEGKDIVHVGEDAVDGTWTGIKNAGGWLSDHL